ncbi:hypothetical protein HAX54_040645, partial [Datura stramonium]|nr:hypothetical protein [Datura stramonium]
VSYVSTWYSTTEPLGIPFSYLDVEASSLRPLRASILALASLSSALWVSLF